MGCVGLALWVKEERKNYLLLNKNFNDCESGYIIIKKLCCVLDKQEQSVGLFDVTILSDSFA